MRDLLLLLALASAACAANVQPVHSQAQKASPDRTSVFQPRERRQLPGQEAWRVEEQRRVDEQTRQARQASDPGGDD